MLIYLFSPSGRGTQVVEVQPEDTIAEARHKAFFKLGYHVKFLFNGREIPGDHLVDDYDFATNRIMYVPSGADPDVVMTGGARRRKSKRSGSKSSRSKKSSRSRRSRTSKGKVQRRKKH